MDWKTYVSQISHLSSSWSLRPSWCHPVFFPPRTTSSLSLPPADRLAPWDFSSSFMLQQVPIYLLLFTLSTGPNQLSSYSPAQFFPTWPRRVLTACEALPFSPPVSHSTGLPQPDETWTPWKRSHRSTCPKSARICSSNCNVAAFASLSLFRRAVD